MPGVTMAETHAEVSPVKEKKKSKKESAQEGVKDKEVVKKSKSKKEEEQEGEQEGKKGSKKDKKGNKKGGEEADQDVTQTKKRKKSSSEDLARGETDEEVSEPKKKKKKSGKSSKSSDSADSKTSDDVEVAEKDDDSKNTDENLSEEEFDPLAVTEFRISEGIRQKLAAKGIKSLFPIQGKTFDIIFEGGDIVARARTGQGKTLAFVLPIINRILEEKSNNRAFQRPPTVLVLAPTRELAKQVAQDFEYFSDVINLATLCVYGGVPIPPQEQALRKGVDVVVGTPGRVKDLIERGRLNLSQIKYRVLDEADEMLNMGFVDDVELILGKVEDPEKVQTLLFSATMPEWVNKISQRFFKSNKTVVDLVGNEKLKANENIKHYALRCNWSQKSQIVTDVIRCYGKDGRVIVFTETKRDCDELVKDISHVSAFAIHGDVSQNVRETTLAGFRSGKFKVLVATDVAARGLDISDVELVIQIEPPRTEETYIHRSGRTGRAGNKGISVMLFTPKKQYFVRTIEHNCGIKFEYIGPPNTSDIVKASAHVAVESIKGVSDNAIDFFQEAAQNLINEGLSPVHLLAKAMAKIAGYSDLKERSLLSSQEDATTLYFKTDAQIRSPLYVISYLRRIMPDDAVNAVKKITMTKDKLGAVFDVPSTLADTFIKASQNDSEKSGPYAHTTLSKPNVLPDLVYLGSEGNGYSNGGRGGFRGNGYGNGRSSGGSYGGRGGDRRGGSGGAGGRGRPPSRGRR